MAKKLYEEASVQAIANAIRAKNGSTATYKVAQMADAVLAIAPLQPDVESASLRPLRYISMLYFQGFAGFRLIENQV